MQTSRRKWLVGMGAAALAAVTTVTAGKRDGTPCYGVRVVWVNQSSETVVWGQLIGPKVGGMTSGLPLGPGETRSTTIAYDPPPGGFPPDWMAYGGKIGLNSVIGTTVESASHHVKCFAYLRQVTVTWDKHGKARIEVEE